VIQRWMGLYRDYARSFWLLVVVMFIDAVGGGLLYPFFALYITERFGASMTQVGYIFLLFSLTGFAGSMLGGALADRMGRKGILVFSLLASSGSALLMGLMDTLGAFFALALLVGLFANVGQPAYQAMIADLLPERKQAQGFGVVRVATNLSMVIGPAIGGFLIDRSYLLLFITDAAISLMAALALLAWIPETRPQPRAEAGHESTLDTFRGYGRVIRDRLFVLFLLAGLLMALAYMNLNTTLGVYLRDNQGVSETGYGWLLSLNAALVVVFQFPLTRRLEGRPPMLVMALGTALVAIGFALYGFVSGYGWFAAAMVILTVGEMLVVPVSQAVAAHFAPPDMRGRYLAVYGLSWGIPYAVGPLLAGFVLDRLAPYWLWYAAGLVGAAAAVFFVALHYWANPQPVRLGGEE